MSDTIMGIICRAVRLRLDGAWMLGVYGPERCAMEFNGIGSEAMPAAARKVLDGLHSCMLPAALLHDVAWALDSNGGDDYFHASNEAFYRNCLVCIEAYYPWYNPVRLWQRHRARQFYAILEKWGWDAYKAAYEKRFSRETS